MSTENTPKLREIDFGTSWVWKHFALLVDGPRKNTKGVETDIVCRECFDAKVRLRDCLVALHARQSSNAIRHMHAKHSSLVPKPTTDKKPSVSPETRPEAGLDVFLQEGNDASIARVHACVARLVVNRANALSLATDVDLNAVIDAATYLTPGSYRPMTKGKMDKSLVQMFNSFVLSVKSLFVKARALYAPAQDSGECCGWLTVCHDGWDSSVKQFFGVSVFWIDLEAWQPYRLALGLAAPISHSAEACAEAALGVLARYGATQTDIFASFNDTTNAAMATGRLLAGQAGSCNMHVAQLVADHATGKRTRSVNKKVVDSFPECDAIRSRVRGMIGYIWSRKAKSRMIAYKARNTMAKKSVIRVGMDNATRIAGTERMYKQSLRSRWCMSTYFALEPSAGRTHELGDEEWVAVAQVEAVLRPICALAFTTQIDTRLVAGSSWPHILR